MSREVFRAVADHVFHQPRVPLPVAGGMALRTLGKARDLANSRASWVTRLNGAPTVVVFEAPTTNESAAAGFTLMRLLVPVTEPAVAVRVIVQRVDRPG
jgi:hypothetical protein